MMMSPRLVIESSAITEGRCSSSNFGISLWITLSTMPVRPSWVNAFTRKRPMPPGLIAKLSSLFASNSAAWRSFIRARASSTVCCGESGALDTGISLPSTLNAGGNSAVRKRSEPFFDTIRRSRSCRNLEACSRSSDAGRGIAVGAGVAGAARSAIVMSIPLAGEVFLDRRGGARLLHRDDVAPDEVGEALVQRLHAERGAGLDGGVHLRDLGLADQVADGRRADHDLVRRDPAVAVLGLQERLRDDRLERFRQHRADHVLLRGGEDVDDPVDGLGSRGRVQRAEHQVAGLGGGQREADRLEV